VLPPGKPGAVTLQLRDGEKVFDPKQVYEKK
jgi:hypothetical protein